MRLMVQALGFFAVALVVSIAAGTVSFLGYAMDDDAFVLQRPVSILIVGVDTESGHKGRADTILLLLVNAGTGRASAMSIYRDALVPEGHGARSASTLYAKKGLEALASRIGSLLGIKIDHSVAINHAAFRKAVDLVGGITVRVPYDMFRDDDDPARRIDLKKGEQVLNGKKALMMVRFRKEPLQDVDRVRNQQTVLRALIAEVLRKKALYMVPFWYRQIKQDIQTDLREEDLVTLAGFLWKVPPEKWTWESLPGRVTESGRFAPDVEKARERVEYLYGKAE
jgi:LCP family protein required for cell wall assembly